MKILLSLLLTTFSLQMQALTIDTSTSKFTWTATKKTGAKQFGTIKLKSSSLKTTKGKISGGKFVMNMSEIEVAKLNPKSTKRFLDHIKSADFFEVKKYPISTLTIEKVEKNVAYGTLKIKDKSTPVNFPFTKTKNSYKGTLKFDRTKVGVIYGSGNFFKELTVDKIINNEVTLDFVVNVK